MVGRKGTQLRFCLWQVSVALIMSCVGRECGLIAQPRHAIGGGGMSCFDKADNWLRWGESNTATEKILLHLVLLQDMSIVGDTRPHPRHPNLIVRFPCHLFLSQPPR